jgi:hypothetical protein
LILSNAVQGAIYGAGIGAFLFVSAFSIQIAVYSIESRGFFGIGAVIIAIVVAVFWSSLLISLLWIFEGQKNDVLPLALRSIFLGGVVGLTFGYLFSNKRRWRSWYDSA